MFNFLSAYDCKYILIHERFYDRREPTLINYFIPGLPKGRGGLFQLPPGGGPIGGGPCGPGGGGPPILGGGPCIPIMGGCGGPPIGGRGPLPMPIGGGPMLGGGGPPCMPIGGRGPDIGGPDIGGPPDCGG